MPRLDNPIFAVALIALGMALVPLNDAGIALLDQGNVENGVAPMPILQIITGVQRWGWPFLRSFREPLRACWPLAHGLGSN